MLVAELELTEGNFAAAPVIHTIGFDDLAQAYAEYERVAALLLKAAERKNDTPKIVEIEGAIGKFRLTLDGLRSVGLRDFAKQNEQIRGTFDAYPFLFKR